jgi:hypothetical protein
MLLMQFTGERSLTLQPTNNAKTIYTYIANIQESTDAETAVTALTLEKCG